MTEAWAASVRLRMTEADEVVVTYGEHTGDSHRVSAEIAQERHKPYVFTRVRLGSSLNPP